MQSLGSTAVQTPPLRTVREARGMSLREVARLAEVDPGQLSRVERGLESLSLSSLRRVAHVLGLRELAQLLGQYTGEGAA